MSLSSDASRGLPSTALSTPAATAAATCSRRSRSRSRSRSQSQSPPPSPPLSRSRSRSQSCSRSRSRSRSPTPPIDAREPWECVGCDVFFRGLPYSISKPDLRAFLRAPPAPAQEFDVASITFDRARHAGSATVRFASRIEASRAIVELDGVVLRGRALRVAAAKMYFRQPPWSGMFEESPTGADGGAAGGDAGGVVPVSFAGRGSKQVEQQSEAVNYKWRALYCKICGLRGHNVDSCPMSLREFHERVVARSVRGGIPGIQAELKLGDDCGGKDSVDGASKQSSETIDRSDSYQPQDQGSAGESSRAVLRSSVPRRGMGRLSVMPAWMTKAAETTQHTSTADGQSKPVVENEIADAVKRFDADTREKARRLQQQKEAIAIAEKEAKQAAAERSRAAAQRRAAAVTRAKQEKARARRRREEAQQDPIAVAQEWEARAREYYSYYGTQHVQSWSMDDGMTIQYHSAYVEVPAEYQTVSNVSTLSIRDPDQPPKLSFKGSSSTTRQSDGSDAVKTLNPLFPNRLYLVRQLPSGYSVRVDITPKKSSTTTSAGKVGVEFEDLSEQIQTIGQRSELNGPDNAIASLLLIAQRAYPIMVPRDFRSGMCEVPGMDQSTIGGVQLPQASSNDTTGEPQQTKAGKVVASGVEGRAPVLDASLQKLNVGQAIDVLQQLDDAAVGRTAPFELSPLGGWWAVWSKPHGCYYYCRYSESPATDATGAADDRVVVPPPALEPTIESSWTAPWVLSAQAAAKRKDQDDAQATTDILNEGRRSSAHGRERRGRSSTDRDDSRRRRRSSSSSRGSNRRAERRSSDSRKLEESSSHRHTDGKRSRSRSRGGDKDRPRDRVQPSRRRHSRSRSRDRTQAAHQKPETWAARNERHRSRTTRHHQQNEPTDSRRRGLHAYDCDFPRRNQHSSHPDYRRGGGVRGSEPYRRSR